MDGEARRAEQALFQLVTEESGAVDYLARVQIAAAGMQQPFAAVEGAVQHFDVETGLGAMGQRLLQIGERRGPRVDQMFPGDPHRAEHVAGQLRLQRQDLVATDLADVIDTVAVGLLDDSRQARQILVAPCRHQGAGFQQRQVEARMDVAVFAIALLHAGQFDAAGRRVETGMEDRAVALAGTGEDVGAFFQQDHPRTFQGEAAGHGATHHASADHCNVEDRGLCRKRLSHRFCLFLLVSVCFLTVTLIFHTEFYVKFVVLMWQLKEKQSID